MPLPTNNYKNGTFGETSFGVPPAPSRRHSSPLVVLPVQHNASDAVCSFMVDCLVPLLGERFRRDQDRADHDQIKVTGHDSTIAPLDREDGR
jgi:hypothetical protein